MKTTSLKTVGPYRVSVAGFPTTVRRWVPGQQMPSQLIAFDTETTFIQGHEIPQLALSTASSGKKHVLIHPDDLGSFLLAHPQAEFVCHNVAFDYWVVHQHLSQRAEFAALEVWTQIVVDRRFHDTMLLDILIRLSNDSGRSTTGKGDGIPARNLADVVRAYTGMEISKADPYRFRFGEIIDCDWSTVDPGFFQYAITDSVSTLHAFREMRERAAEIMAAQGYRNATLSRFDIYPDAPQRFGLLSEAIQVEGAIALAALTRNGLCTDSQKLEVSCQEFDQKLSTVVNQLCTEFPGFLVTDRLGNLMLTKSGLPKQSDKRLNAELLAAAERVRQQTGRDLPVPRAPKGKVSHALDDWKDFGDQDTFLTLWGAYKTLTKQKQFLELLKPARIHPRYTVLVRTGRTSCSKPNMQQMPRDRTVRNIIVPSPGHLLLIVDYSYIELVTLAAVCQARFGYSHLGKVIQQGIDPHCHTAAMLAGLTLSAFMDLKNSDLSRFKICRQQAKPINFGVPGGMGAKALVRHAKEKYGVQLTLEEAKMFHGQLTQKIYPELEQYLAGDGLSGLSRRLHVSEAACIKEFCFRDSSPSHAAGMVKKIVGGKPTKADGTPYNSDYVQRTWASLIKLNRNTDLKAILARRVGTPELAARLFTNAAVTLTGRVRGDVSYTERRNTPFQSLASDGAKRALWHLVLDEYRVVGFIHDEILIELPDQGGYVDRSIVDSVVRVMRESMQEFTGGIPVQCEYGLSVCWSKEAELILDGDKVLPWQPPVQS